MHAPRTSSPAARLAVALAVAGAAVAGGCFDSDDKLRFEGTTGNETTSTTTTTTSTTTEEGTTEGPSDLTCRDAIGCIQDCAVDLILNPQPEPDLSCILTCVEQEGLSTRETYHLLNLANCSGDLCSLDGFCGDGGAGTDTDAGSTGGSTGTTGGTTGGIPPGSGLLDPCFECLFRRMGDQSIPGCEEEHAACL